MRDALDLEYYAGLEHEVYEYLNVLPREYIVHLETNYCPLDVQAIKEVKEHFYRGWDRAANKRLSKFSTRLDQEQGRMAIDGVIIPNDDKFQHYLTEIDNSGIFSAEAITQWTEKPLAQQTYANARTFFESKQRGMETIQRLTAGRIGGAGYGTAAAALELKEVIATMKEAIEETVAQALEDKENNAPANSEEQANAMRQLREDNTAHKKELGELARAVQALTAEIKRLKEANETLKKKSQGPTVDAPPPPAEQAPEGQKLRRQVRVDHRPTVRQKVAHGQKEVVHLRVQEKRP